jgi:putative flippase GtrA
MYIRKVSTVVFKFKYGNTLLGGMKVMELIRDKVKWLFQKLVNRETITYAIAGTLTTIVNFVSLELLCGIGIPTLTANAIAWVIAVTFAYLVNKINVFKSTSEDAKDEAKKVTKFFGLRLITLGVEQLGMLIFVVWLGFYRLLVKAFLAVIVIVLNYVFSKLLIFQRKK